MMRVSNHWSWNAAILHATKDFRDYSELVHTEKWQGTDISQRPEMATHELLNYSLSAPVPENLADFAARVKPNLPWADKHFEERVCGEPINPGIEWQNWPFNRSADTFRDPSGKFNHNYMERYWPRRAGFVDQATRTAEEFREEFDAPATIHSLEFENFGIYHRYGDLNDIIKLLEEQPLTRQAYMPIFFPEDTGAHHGGRLPCTLGYHFILRNGHLHCVYFLRSCDFVRHFRDDVYLTGRLLVWVMARLREADPKWNEVKVGNLTMHITSFHMFRNDYIAMFGSDR